MIGQIDLASALKNRRSPRWIRLVAKHTRWKHASIETLTANQLANLINARPAKTIVLVNKGHYKCLNKLVSVHGLLLSTPSIRNVYSLRYAD